MAAKLDAIVFDAYGTLYDVFSVTSECSTLFAGHGPAVAQLWRTKQLEYSWLASLMGRYRSFSALTLEALEFACSAQGIVLDDAARKRLLDAYRKLAPFPDVVETLERFSALKLAILSNGSLDMLEPLVAASPLKERFAAVLSVEPAQVFKPHPSVYQLAVDCLGMQRERIGFVSANCWDACGAQSFGFQAFWVNRTGAPLDRLGIQPAAVVGALTDLPSLLGL